MRLTLVGAAATTAVLAAVLATPTATAAPVASDAPTASKAGAPSNVNPDKHPVTDSTRIAPVESMPLTDSQAVGTARAWAAQDPNSRVVCFAPDGTVIAAAELDRVDPSHPPAAQQRAQVCRNALSPGRP